jgi:hypothetical protein
MADANAGTGLQKQTPPGMTRPTRKRTQLETFDIGSALGVRSLYGHGCSRRRRIGPLGSAQGPIPSEAVVKRLAGESSHLCRLAVFGSE